MSTGNEAIQKTTFGRKKGIRDIPEILSKGYRMAPGQLRFCIAAAVVLVTVILIVMFIAGGRASNNVAVNEEAAVLQDAVRAERIEALDAKTIRFAESPVYDGNGKRLILTEKVVTSKSYWVVMCPESEIAEYESVIGEGRFLQLETIGNNSIWITMASDDEIGKCAAAVEGSGLVQLNAMENLDWLNRGTAEENKKAAEAFENVEFIQFEKLGTTSIRLRRGTEGQIAETENAKSRYRLIRLCAILLLLVAAGVFAYGLKSSNMQKKPAGARKLVCALALVIGLAMVFLTVYMSVRMDDMQYTLVREGPMIMAAAVRTSSSPRTTRARWRSSSSSSRRTASRATSRCR